MRLKRYNEERDYKTLAKWWDEHDEAVVPPSHLPVNGFVIDNVAAGFIYQTDSQVAFLENFIANPEATPHEVHEALIDITSGLCDLAQTLGYEDLIILTSKPSVGRVIMRCGFQRTSDKKLTIYAARMN